MDTVIIILLMLALLLFVTLWDMGRTQIKELTELKRAAYESNRKLMLRIMDLNTQASELNSELKEERMEIANLRCRLNDKKRCDNVSGA